MNKSFEGQEFLDIAINYEERSYIKNPPDSTLQCSVIMRFTTPTILLVMFLVTTLSALCSGSPQPEFKIIIHLDEDDHAPAMTGIPFSS